MVPRRKEPTYTSVDDEDPYQSLPTPEQYYQEPAMAPVDPGITRYTLYDQPTLARPSERYAYEPTEMNYAELENAVAMLEEQVSPKFQNVDVASDTATLISQTSDRSKQSSSSSASAATVIEPTTQWAKTDVYEKANYYNNINYNNAYDQGPISLEDPAPSRVWAPGTSQRPSTDPFADPSAASSSFSSPTPTPTPSPPKPQLAGPSFQRRQPSSKTPVIKFPTLDAIIEARSIVSEPSISEPVSSDAFHHDPENHALDATPDKYHTRPLRMRSRSPTPDPATALNYDVSPVRTVVSTQYERPGGTITTPERRALLAMENRAPTTSLSPKREPPAWKSTISTTSPYTTPPPVASTSYKANSVTAPASPIVESPTRHFGPAPRQQRRRHKGTKKIVPLTQYVSTKRHRMPLLINVIKWSFCT